MPFLGKTPSQIVDPEVDIDGGSIDGTAIGATSASTATVSTLVVEESSVVQSAQPNDIAVFKRADNGYIKIYSPNTHNGGIAFGDPDDPFAGAIRYQHSTDHLDFYVNNAERMRIDSSGNVGIGVTDVKGTLSVIGPDATYQEYLNVGHSTSSARLHFTPWSTLAQDRVYLAHNIYRSSTGGFGNDKTGIGMSYVGFLDSGSIAFGAEGTASSTAPTERMRILSSGGITFNGDTAAANALDDYEEGTWTPTVWAANGTTVLTSGVDYSVQTATYTKVGNLVHVVYRIQDLRGGSKDSLMSTIPFASANGDYTVGVAIADNAAYGPGEIFMLSGGTKVQFRYNMSGQTYKYGTFTYRTAT